MKDILKGLETKRHKLDALADFKNNNVYFPFTKEKFFRLKEELPFGAFGEETKRAVKQYKEMLKIVKKGS